MLTTIRLFIARAMVRMAIGAAPQAAAARLQEAFGPVWQTLRGGGGPKPVVPK